jgi:uncharacterized metal-binding protein
MTWNRDGDKHDHNAAITAALVLIGGIISMHLIEGILISATVVVWGLWFSPDLDLSESGRWKGGACKAWHRWKRIGLGWFWKPYGRAIKHRNPFSHSLFPGTLIRLIYVLIIPALVALAFNFQLISLPDFIGQHLPYQITFTRKFYELIMKSILTGALIADAVHLATDGILIKRIIVLP